MLYQNNNGPTFERMFMCEYNFRFTFRLSDYKPANVFQTKVYNG